MKKPAVVYTFISENYYHGIGLPVFVNSFKHFHPDIPLVVFRGPTVARVFAEQGLNWLIAKAAFARRLTAEYDLVVNMDADHVITGYMEAVFDRDYDIGAPWNFNDYQNATYANISFQMYLQGGLIGSRSPRFWEIYDKASRDHWRDHGSHENNTLNMLWYNDPETMAMRRLVYDRERDYYGCKALNREPEFYIEKGALLCRGERVLAYHHAKGGHAIPKLVFDRMNFSPAVTAWLKEISSGDETGKFISL